MLRQLAYTLGGLPYLWLIAPMILGQLRLILRQKASCMLLVSSYICSCVLTSQCCVLHALQFISSANTSSTSTATANRRKASSANTTPGPPTSAAAAASAASAALPHQIPAHLQQHWLQAALPAILRHLQACYCYLLGCEHDGSGNSSRNATGHSRVSKASNSSIQQPVGRAGSLLNPVLPGSCSCMLPLTSKQQSAVDQVRSGVAD